MVKITEKTISIFFTVPQGNNKTWIWRSRRTKLQICFKYPSQAMFGREGNPIKTVANKLRKLASYGDVVFANAIYSLTAMLLLAQTLIKRLNPWYFILIYPHYVLRKAHRRDCFSDFSFTFFFKFIYLFVSKSL